MSSYKDFNVRIKQLLWNRYNFELSIPTQMDEGLLNL